MAWIRLDDDYIYHPKFRALSHHAFRLWHEGMCYCRKLMTDGLIRIAALKKFLYYSPKAVEELLTPCGQSEALWLKDPAGYRVHDYLDWNPSHQEEAEEREAAKQRMRAYRGRRAPPVTPFVTPPVTANVTPLVTPVVTPHVPGEGKGSDQEKKIVTKPIASLAPDEVASRAGALLLLYAELYQKYRHGAKLRLLHNSLEFQDACALVTTWDDARLAKLAVLVLDTDDPFISGTDRSFKIFALKASWADDKLRAWEVANGVRV